MCLAVPGKIISIDACGTAEVDMLGTHRQASLRLTPQAQVGDYALIHAGFAIQVIEEDEAQETIRLIRQLPEFCEEVIG